MPRRSKGPRLYLRRARPGIGRKAVWLIRDGQRDFATGCVGSPADKGPPEAAQRALADYIANKYSPARKARDIERIDIADVLTIYLDDCGDEQADRKKFEGRISRLNSFWGGRMLSEVSTATCKEYVKVRGNTGGARRDLEICARPLAITLPKISTGPSSKFGFPQRAHLATGGSHVQKSHSCCGLAGVTAKFNCAIAGPTKVASFLPRSDHCVTYHGSFL